MPELLDVADLHAWYGESHVLHGMEFAVDEGELVTLLGRNGAGKTTTLRAIMGIIGQRSGSVRLHGTELTTLPSNRIARLGVGYCPEERGVFASLDVEENLLLPPVVRPCGMRVAEIYAIFSNLEERRRSQGTKLSGGEQQMVAVARALSGDVRVLLLDEPFEGLAPAVVEQLFETFDRLRKEIAIVIVDHHLDLALALSDTTVALERGQVVHDGPSRDLRDDLDLRRKVLWL